MATLLHAMNHHAKDKVEVVNAITFMFTTELSQAGWKAMSVRGGAGSWMFHHPKTGKQLHFRDGGKGTINVYDHWNAVSLGRKPTAILSSRVGVYRWAQNLKP